MLSYIINLALQIAFEHINSFIHSLMRFFLRKFVVLDVFTHKRNLIAYLQHLITSLLANAVLLLLELVLHLIAVELTTPL